jgi:hypothetical protein
VVLPAPLGAKAHDLRQRDLERDVLDRLHRLVLAMEQRAQAAEKALLLLVHLVVLGQAPHADHIASLAREDRPLGGTGDAGFAVYESSRKERRPALACLVDAR